jgi:hypothetical protein
MALPMRSNDNGFPLYDTGGPALQATLEPGEFISTLDMKTKFLRPAL